MADLSPEQTDFLRKHLGFDTAGFIRKRKLKSQLEKFWRRRDKTQSELDVLPPDHPRRPEFADAISAATKTAEGGDLKSAYDSLAAVKIAARTEADTVKNGLSLATVNGDLTQLLNKTRAVKEHWDRKMADMHARAERQEFLVTMTPDASAAPDRDEIIHRAGLLVAAKKDFVDRLDQMAADAERQKSDYRAFFDADPKTKPTLERLEHNAQLLRDAGKMVGSVEAQLATINQRVVEYKMLGGGYEFGNQMDQRIRECRKVVLDELEARMKLPAMEPSGSTDKTGERLSEVEAELAVSKPKAEGQESGLKSIFADIEKRDAERVEAAR